MLYNKLSNSDIKVSALGMGCEYVWHASEKEVNDLVSAAVNAGINYFDIFVATPSTRRYYGNALKPVRDKVVLAAHLGAAEFDNQYAKTRDLALCKKFLDEFYENLQTDYIDVLFLHNTDEEDDYNKIMNEGMYDYALKLKNEGKVGLIGISTHNTRIAMKAVASGKIQVLMFPVNPLFNMLPQDIGDSKMKGRKVKEMSEEEKATYPSKQELYDLCKEKGVSIVAMKPFAAGNILKDHEEGRLKGLLNLTPVQCISYILSIPEVACPVPGFKNVDELSQSLKYFEATEEEKDFSEINDSLVAKFEKTCMYCNHCQPCPSGLDIAQITKLADMAQNEMNEDIKQSYYSLKVKAEDCIECSSCTERCPFGIDAQLNMQRAKDIFGC